MNHNFEGEQNWQNISSHPYNHSVIKRFFLILYRILTFFRRKPLFGVVTDIISPKFAKMLEDGRGKYEKAWKRASGRKPTLVYNVIHIIVYTCKSEYITAWYTYFV